MALGLEKAGFETKLLVEYDKDCVATLQNNRPKWNVSHDDIHNITFKGMKADVVTGGFPCQAFSHAGNKLGFEDTRGTLFYEFARAVKEIKPKIFL
ncbi:MAG: DNA (cytosine-5-)-methyltransferase, partial [Thaumarchaeota archaeon]|nr:DNA (cytosine-5-)-methyltransferase [Nitrososphaerota archaeon]